MIIGAPKEIKRRIQGCNNAWKELRSLKKDGHTILVETDAGEGSGFSDDEYLQADADIVDRTTVFKKSDLIVKVKEPLPQEYDLLREGQAIFTYLHLAPNRELTELLLKKTITGIAYETLQKTALFLCSLQ